MVAYLFLLSLTAILALTRMQIEPQNYDVRPWGSIWRVVFVIFTLMIGLRHQVGGDWAAYLRHIDEVTNVPFAAALATKDPAAGVLNWIGGHWGSIYFVNTVCAAIFTWGLIAFSRSQPLPWLALAVAVPYLVTVVAMGYTRQGVAIGLSMLGLVAISKGRLIQFVSWIAVAALFHKSAVMLVVLGVLAGSKRRLLTFMWIAIAGVILFVLLLQESVENLRYGYIQNEIQSSGAGIRIAMNALPALVFLILRGRFKLSQNLKKFWTWMAFSALAFVVLLFASPSSTAVDRMALYWIPLQLFVLSRLPIALNGVIGRKSQWVALVVAYSFAVQLVWLMYAEHAYYWLPYKFFPWEWMWQ